MSRILEQNIDEHIEVFTQCGHTFEQIPVIQRRGGHKKKYNNMHNLRWGPPICQSRRTQHQDSENEFAIICHACNYPAAAKTPLDEQKITKVHSPLNYPAAAKTPLDGPQSRETVT